MSRRDLERSRDYYRDVAAVEAEQHADHLLMLARQRPLSVEGGGRIYYPRRNLLRARRAAHRRAEEFRRMADRLDQLV